MILPIMPIKSASEQPGFLSREVRKARRFYLELNPRTRRQVSVAFGGWEQCSASYHIQRDGFPFYLVEFVAGGEGEIRLRGRRHALRRGSIFTYGPACPHEVTTDPHKCLSKYFVGISGSAAFSLMKTHALAPGTYRDAAESDDIQAAFDHLIVEGMDKAKDTAEILSLQIQVLLLKMSKRAEGSKRPAHQAFQTFVRCRTFLDEHYLDVATAAEAAEACHLDPAYASRLFARFGQGSFYGYLLRRKMTWAADLLADGRLIVREAAEELGMNAFHFSRVFKRVHGISPSSFLQRMTNLVGRD